MAPHSQSPLADSGTVTDRWQPPVPLCSASQKTSFAYTSTVTRWPIILTGVIDELAKLNGKLLREEDSEKLKESKEIIASIAAMVYEMRHDRELSPLPRIGLPDDSETYNTELEKAKESNSNRWFTVSWLFGECYMYRRLRCIFAATKYWNDFDPFAKQKLDAFRSSEKGIMTLSESLQALVQKGTPTDEELHADWTKMLEIGLWGNATDLSLLTSLTHEDIQALQNVERGSSFILKNDLAAVWDYVKDFKGERIDIVLDNSGFELYSDLVLADWLVTVSPFCKEVVLHPKLLPWFVSDVQPHDFDITLASLLDPNFFPARDDETTRDKSNLKAMVSRWQDYVEKGVFRLSVPKSLAMGAKGGEVADFWTGPHPFSDMPKLAPELLAELQKSALVIFKGDLNYRKLTGDACWPTTTSFEETLGPLAGEIPILSLRTCKADVCVGLDPGKSEQLDIEAPDWRVSGKYAVISFSPRNRTT